MKMNNLKVALLGLLLCTTTLSYAQSVDEIIKNYYENTGGYAKRGELKNTRMKGKLNQGGLEIPAEIVQTSDGRQYLKFNFQGQTLMQNVFDGKTLWSTNFQTMKAEKADAESTENQKLDNNDFPESLYEYKKKAYTAELIGKETFEGTEAYKIKLTKEPITVDGQKTDNITYYYIDADSYALLGEEVEVKQGPAKGMTSITKMGDYQEVNGLYFPFKITQNLKGQPGGFSIQIDTIELNVELNDKDFAFPEGE